MTNRGPPGQPRHDAPRFAAVPKPEHLAHRANAAIRVEKLLPLGMIARHARRELPTVLHIEQNPRNQPRGLLGALWAKRAHGVALKMVNRGQSALMMKLTH